MYCGRSEKPRQGINKGGKGERRRIEASTGERVVAVEKEQENDTRKGRSRNRDQRWGDAVECYFYHGASKKYSIPSIGTLGRKHWYGVSENTYLA
jgi:hypothetical protein